MSYMRAQSRAMAAVTDRQYSPQEFWKPECRFSFWCVLQPSIQPHQL